jgi:hypothetical protein
MPRQERIKTVVLASRQDFRTAMVSYLNQAGFAAEKRLVTELSEIEPLMEDQLLWNFVVDLDKAALGEARMLLRELTHLISDTRIHPLIYLSQGADAEAGTLAAEFPGCVVVTKPISRQHLADALVKPFMARHGHLKRVRRSDPQQNALITETIAHIKSAVDSLKKLAADPSATSELVTVGQRFNGVYGTFKFFASHPGYHELMNVSEVIDSIALTYSSKGQGATPDPQHVSLMFDAARAAFELLKVMRDGHTPDEKLLERCGKVHGTFAARTDLKKRQASSQEEVDALLASLGA